MISHCQDVLLTERNLDFVHCFRVLYDVVGIQAFVFAYLLFREFVHIQVIVTPARKKQSLFINAVN